jgi:hypothetical protein
VTFGCKSQTCCIIADSFDPHRVPAGGLYTVNTQFTSVFARHIDDIFSIGGPHGRDLVKMIAGELSHPINIVAIPQIGHEEVLVMVRDRADKGQMLAIRRRGGAVVAVCSGGRLCQPVPLVPG